MTEQQHKTEADPGISKPWGAVPALQNYQGLRFVLYAPFNTYSMVFSEKKEQSTYCKHCLMDTIEVYAYYTVKIYK